MCLEAVPLWLVIVSWTVFAPILAVASLWYAHRGETARERILGRFVLPLIVFLFTIFAGRVAFILLRMP